MIIFLRVVENRKIGMFDNVIRYNFKRKEEILWEPKFYIAFDYLKNLLVI